MRWQEIVAAVALAAAAALAGYIVWLRRRIVVDAGKLSDAKEEAGHCEAEARVDDETDGQLDADLRRDLDGEPKPPGGGTPPTRH